MLQVGQFVSIDEEKYMQHCDELGWNDSAKQRIHDCIQEIKKHAKCVKIVKILSQTITLKIYWKKGYLSGSTDRWIVFFDVVIPYIIENGFISIELLCLNWNKELR